MSKVLMKRSVSTAGGKSFSIGEHADVEPAVARSWIAGGVADKVAGESYTDGKAAKPASDEKPARKRSTRKKAAPKKAAEPKVEAPAADTPPAAGTPPADDGDAKSDDGAGADAEGNGDD